MVRTSALCKVPWPESQRDRKGRFSHSHPWPVYGQLLPTWCCPRLCCFSVSPMGLPWESWCLCWWYSLRVSLEFPSLWCPRSIGFSSEQFVFCTEVSGSLLFLILGHAWSSTKVALCVSAHPIPGASSLSTGLHGVYRGLVVRTLGCPAHPRIPQTSSLHRNFSWTSAQASGPLSGQVNSPVQTNRVTKTNIYWARHYSKQLSGTKPWEPPNCSVR